VREHAVDGVKVLSALIVQPLRLGLELVEPAFRVDIDGILSVLANVEFDLELLGCLSSSYPKSASLGHPCMLLPGWLEKKTWKQVELEASPCV
jgi:hypothetical protein